MTCAPILEAISSEKGTKKKKSVVLPRPLTLSVNDKTILPFPPQLFRLRVSESFLFFN